MVRRRGPNELEQLRIVLGLAKLPDPGHEALALGIGLLGDLKKKEIRDQQPTVLGLLEFVLDLSL